MRSMRQCAACGQQLSRYNTAERCHACVRAGSGRAAGVETPPGLLLRPDLRRALAEWDWSTVLRAISTETGASQTDLAVATGLTQPDVSRLMNGKSRQPGIGTTRALCDGLGIPRDLAGLAATTSDELEEGATDRRSLLAGTVGAAVLSAAMVADAKPAHIGMADVNQLQTAARELRVLDRLHGGDALCEAGARYVRRADEWLNLARYSSDTGRELQVAFSKIAQITGWLHYDAGRQAAARRYYLEALSAAQLARDAELEILVLSTLSTQALHLGRPREAVQLAQRAQERASGWATPRVHALLLVREATGWARCRDNAAARRVLIESENVFDPRPEPDDPYWIGFFDHAELMGLKAANLSYLGKYDRAASLLEQAVQQQAGDELRRNHVWFRVVLAEQRLKRGDLNGACEVVARDLPVLSHLGSTRTRRRLSAVCRSLERTDSRRAREVVDHARRLGVAHR
ncbi:MAG: helix-turn-helix domain-containing protein [Dehalococcoidia bacterium]